MKNVRRLLIVMTFAIMALLMMTGAAFAETKIVADGQEVQLADAEAKMYDVFPVKYAVLDKLPNELTVTSDEFTEFVDDNSYQTHALPFDKDTIIGNFKTSEGMFWAYTSILEEMGVTTADHNLYCFYPSDESVYFIIAIKEDIVSIGDLSRFRLGEGEVIPAATYSGADGAAVLLRANEYAAFSALAAKDLTVKNYSDSFSAAATAGQTYSVAARLMAKFNTRFDIPEDDVKALLKQMGKESEYYEDHSYKAVIFTNSDEEKLVVLCDFGYPPGPAGTIGQMEQLTDESVSIEITGEDIDFSDYFISQWFKAELKDDEGETIPAEITIESIDADHVKCSYSTDPSYENSLGSEKGKAHLEFSYNGAAESKTFDVDLRASNYWSKYAEEPEKIAKGDKTWPEFAGYYKISTPEELAWFAGLVNGEIEGVEQNSKALAFLANDIICNDTEGWENWDKDTKGLRFWDCTIGKDETTNTTGREKTVFSGAFDGNYHSIKGLFICQDPTVENYKNIMNIALFPVIDNAEIRNLGVEESFITNEGASYSGSFAGGIVCDANKSTIENCWFRGHVAANTLQSSSAAGIAVNTHGIRISGCYNAGIVESTSTRGGTASGIALYQANIENCYDVGTINSSQAYSISAYTKPWNVTVGSPVYSCYSASKVAFANTGSAVSQSFYLEGAPDYADATVLTDEEFKDGTLLEGLDQDAFCADDGDKNGGYPILVWQSDLYQAKQAAEKEIRYHLDADTYALSKKAVNEAVDAAVEAVENAETIDAVKAAKDEAIAALDNFEKDADVADDNAKAVQELMDQLNAINAKLELQGAVVTVAKTSVTANGKEQKPAVTVKGKSGAVLTEGTDYTVSYSSNIKPGIASVTVTGAGAASTEVKTAAFRILPKKMVLKKAAPGKKKLTVTWKKDADVTGYEVQYSLKKNFKGAKTVKAAKAKTVKKVVGKLSSGKTYFVRVRSYKMAGKARLYGEWSAAKKAKIK